MVEWPSRSLALSAAASEGSFSGPVDDYSEGSLGPRWLLIGAGDSLVDGVCG